MARPHDVAPGHWGTGIIFWKPLTKTETDDDGEEREEQFFMLKQYCVFNADQVSGAERFRIGASPVTSESPVVPFEEADRAIAATGADIRYGGDRAFYNRTADFIQVPPQETFSLPEFYETVFHELTHWSESRLKWEGSRPLSELRAEIGSCFAATELGLPTGQNMQNHAAYVKSWILALENDPKYIFDAASQASKAADFILSFSRAAQPADETAAAA